MGNKAVRKFVCYFLFNCLSVISLNVAGQEMLRPIGRPLVLSGNFGELRATHFHSGIDIRTGGVEGLPVVCVKDGQLVRVSVSPTGYGQALYIEHPDGTTTVYGHLQRFIPEIEKVVRELQYSRESFKVDADVRLYNLFFKQGELIAYSGNTGSSGGPHLHFEVRNTETEHTYNPLLYYQIRDQRAAVVRMLYLYSIQDNGYVDLFRACPLKHMAAGRYDGGMVRVPAGKTGIGLYVTDYMNDSWNKLGIYRLDMVAGKDTLLCLKMDSCAFEQGYLINEAKDFDRYKKKETVYRCFGYYLDRFMGATLKDKGHIRVEQDSTVHILCNLSDINGNNSVVEIRLKGTTARQEEDEEGILRYDREHLLKLPGCRVELDSFSLFHSVKKEIRTEEDPVTGGKIYVLSAKDIPLMKKARLYIDGDFGEHAYISESDVSGRKYPVKTMRTEKGVMAEISYLNRYSVDEDPAAPEIHYLGKFPDQSVRFRIEDNESGIADWRAEVNGQWCLFTYDPRVHILQCRLSEPMFRKGEMNEVKIMVTDQAGNAGSLKIKVKK